MPGKTTGGVEGSELPSDIELYRYLWIADKEKIWMPLR